MDVEWTNPFGVLNSALGDSFAVLNKSLMLYAGLALGGLLIDLFLTPLHPFVYYGYHYTATSIVATIAPFFAMANAVRTLAPQYKMTAVDVLAIVGLTILLMVSVGIGCVLLIVPGLFILARFGPIVPVYLVGRAVDSDGGLFKRATDATAHRGWQTLGLFLMIGFIQWILSQVFQMMGVPANGVTALAILNLLYFALSLWISQVSVLAILRWVAVEEPRLVAGAEEGVPVPAAP